MDSFPLISVGVPIFNAEKTIARTLSSLLNQDYPNLEIIVSDNCSTDESMKICKSFEISSDRIKIVSQFENIGPIRNFEYVLQHARGEYFMWCAGDDSLSPTSISENFEALQANPKAVGCSSVNSFEGTQDRKYRHELVGDLKSRVTLFFRHRRELHGNFYCLFRRETLLGCPSLSKSFIGWDWAVIFFLTLRGELIRSGTSEAVFGENGVSRGTKRTLYKVLGLSWIQTFIPYFIFSYHVVSMSKVVVSPRIKCLIFFQLLKLNFAVVKGRFIGCLVDFSSVGREFLRNLART
jgi:glycosyltransferase involved in cell wall biosynthesis